MWAHSGQRIEGMARLARNELNLTEIRPGVWRLFGYHLGKRIRQRSKDVQTLIDRKEELEKALAATSRKEELRPTWLSESQLKDAEAAVLRANGRWPLLDCVVAKEHAAPPPLKPKGRKEAVAAWLKHLEHKLGRFPRTVEKNKSRIDALFRRHPVSYVHEMSGAMAEEHVFRPGIGGRTQVTDASALRTFGAFCLKQGWITSNTYDIDTSQLNVRSTERPRILTPEQCAAYLQAAIDEPGSQLVPFVVLTTWCLLRRAEAERTLPKDIHLEDDHSYIEVDPRKRGTPSYRTVKIPENARRVLIWCTQQELLKDGEPVFFNTVVFNRVRARAGLITIAPPDKRGARSKIVESTWQDNITRHSGISYLYQQNGDIRETTRQAGNSDATAFEHYLQLPRPGAADRFYAIKPDLNGVIVDRNEWRTMQRREAAKKGGASRSPKKLEAAARNVTAWRSRE